MNSGTLSEMFEMFAQIPAFLVDQPRFQKYHAKTKIKDMIDMHNYMRQLENVKKYGKNEHVKTKGKNRKQNHIFQRLSPFVQVAGRIQDFLQGLWFLISQLCDLISEPQPALRLLPNHPRYELVT